MPTGGNRAPPGQVPGIGFAKGFDPRRRPGKKGRSGRVTKVFRETCRDILADAKAHAQIQKVLSNHKDPHFATVLKIVLAYAEGVPKQSLEVEGRLPVLRLVRDEAAVALAVQKHATGDE